MTLRIIVSFIIFFLIGGNAIGQVVGFEEGMPTHFREVGKGSLSLSSAYYKEGTHSLRWKFRPDDTLYISLPQHIQLDAAAKKNSGITLWIYNEKAGKDSIRFDFLSSQGKVVYTFGFRLAAQGWRACWIGFQHMQAVHAGDDISSYRLIAPHRKGSVYLDRITFPVKQINLRTTPDMQMPYNNSIDFRDLWHWCRVWQWEQYAYDIPLPTEITDSERKEINLIEQRLSDALDVKKVKKASTESIEKAYATLKEAHIRPSGSGFTGAPIVAPDELNRQKGEMSWNDLETMLSGFALDMYLNHSQKSAENYFLVWNYAMNQGFAYGSGMGTNHHYGYQVRKIFITAWLVREQIQQAPNSKNILATLRFWAALQETRIPCPTTRDELLDSWHTLTTAKIVSALLIPDEREKIQAMKSLTRWISTSLHYTAGTIGGIKIDGTTFHHGGFYPAYTTGALAELGFFTGLTNGTSYSLTPEARQVFRSALLAMRNYCNLYEWGIGLGGRHPFGGSMRQDDVEAFAHLALSGDFSDEGNAFDHSLAADYLRLTSTNTPEANYFREQGIRPAAAPEGFFVYNYSAAGIFRRANWMVTLKGYNTDVWGAEIYTKDNRYGRYQSYGSVQIMGYESRKASGYDANGWDWNRLPGTTTIHLPFELLDSPLPGTTMARSKENFAGSSTLEGRNGMFAIKLMERSLKNFTPDFVARKSVFCFDNRMVCLGTGINNSNTAYPTETTLFQSTFQPGKSDIYTDDTLHTTAFAQTWNDGQPHHLQDGYHNHYFVKGTNLHVQIAQQESRNEKTRARTEGTFASAYLDHGTAPHNACYEYMVLIQPTKEEVETVYKGNHWESPYQILRQDSVAHVVSDGPTGITAYAAFEAYNPDEDEVFRTLPAETMVMRKYLKNGQLLLSICDPNLNISEKTFTTWQASRPIEKILRLKGKWATESENSSISLFYEKEETILTVQCQDGQPIEFSLSACH
ncbi:MAG: chondroitinase family polysaccharide lyase [Bacteroides sp.]|nr:chondroitinase family polysaccharide lyase [Bacteroides sp.]